MSNLKKYLKTQKENGKIEALTEFLNDQGQWYKDYIYHNEDFLEPYCDILFEDLKYNFYYEELGSEEIEAAVKKCFEENNEDLIYKHITCDLTTGIYRRSSEIDSCNLGEMELQFSGLYDHDTKTNCIYSKLTEEMTEDEINEAINNCNYFISSDCIYIDCTCDRVSLILDEENFYNEFLKTQKKAV